MTLQVTIAPYEAAEAFLCVWSDGDWEYSCVVETWDNYKRHEAEARKAYERHIATA